MPLPPLAPSDQKRGSRIKWSCPPHPPNRDLRCNCANKEGDGGYVASQPASQPLSRPPPNARGGDSGQSFCLNARHVDAGCSRGTRALLDCGTFSISDAPFFSGAGPAERWKRNGLVDGSSSSK
ncbi:hypothetical protein MAPG_00297 [Magnaporthiopsis poae ATCC 64411]|uniref:Uncharacterized protein n=1 Tax=Magnaporthiopsis poae (strain ATCC 64411 / 73-15) TaxID=644358 RepID=A0A0C4DKM0_MAGP6|nr:hypothetical protein MAPG_00297 [Magnaporthiopsis poae ATCC 64411]